MANTCCDELNSLRPFIITKGRMIKMVDHKEFSLVGYNAV
jgi:hypothetical protein